MTRLTAAATQFKINFHHQSSHKNQIYIFYVDFFSAGKSPTIVGKQEKCLLNWIVDEGGKEVKWESFFCAFNDNRKFRPQFLLEFPIFRRDLLISLNIFEIKICFFKSSRKVHGRIKVNLIFWYGSEDVDEVEATQQLRYQRGAEAKTIMEIDFPSLRKLT